MSAIERFEKIDEQLCCAFNGIAHARILIDGIPDQKVARQLKKNLRVIRDKICNVAIRLENSYCGISAKSADKNSGGSR